MPIYPCASYEAVLCNAAQVRPSPLVQIETTPQHCRADDVRKQHAAWLVYNEICTVNSEFRISIESSSLFIPLIPAMSCDFNSYSRSAGGGPARGQGHTGHYYNTNHPEASDSLDDHRYESVPRPPREPGYVPYEDTYNSRDAGQAGEDYSSSSFFSPFPPPPRDQFSPRPDSFNQMAPYDDNKAYAQEQDAWQQDHQQRAYTQNRPPPSAVAAGYGRGGRRSEDSYNDRYYDDDSEYDDDDDRRRRTRRSYQDRRRIRRYSNDDSITEKALRYPSDPKKGGRDFFGASEGERGLGANLAGLAAGGFLGNKFGKGGAISTLGGAVVGAIAAQAAERQYAKRKEEKVFVRRSMGDPYVVPAGPYPQRGRDMDDVRESQRDVDKPVGFREKMRSLSRRAMARTRSRSRPARRSSSVESVEQDHYR